MINVLISSSFRTDGVNIKIMTGKSWMNRETGEIVQELPEGAVTVVEGAEVVSDEWAEFDTFLKSDQTGHVYEIVHEVEGSENTYKEVYLAPDAYSEYRISAKTGGGYHVVFDRFQFPTYISTKTYAKGDIVTYTVQAGDVKTFISLEDDNIGNNPNITPAWGYYLPYPVQLEPHYITYEELIGGDGE